MTCIVGLKTDDGIIMGGDSAGVAGWSLNLTTHPKIFHNGPYLIGYTTSFRMGQLLQFSELPAVPDNEDELMRFMVTTFVDSLRRMFKDGGFAKKKDEREEGGCFLVAIQSRLFTIWDDYQVFESVAGYDSVGCGGELAKGSLWTTGEQGRMEPYERVFMALSAAEANSAGVRGPFHIEYQVNRDRDGS